MAGSGHAPDRLQRLGSDLTPSRPEVLVVATRSRLANAALPPVAAAASAQAELAAAQAALQECAR